MALIDAAFNKLDSNNDGIITVADMKLIYNASADPNARSGKLTVEHALEAFLKQFDGGRPDSKVRQCYLIILVLLTSARLVIQCSN